MGALNGIIPIVDLENPSFDAAKKRLAKLLSLFNLNEVVAMLDQLIAEVDSMPLAGRFDPDKRAWSLLYKEGPIPSNLAHPMAPNASETEYKRLQLKGDLLHIKSQVQALGLRFETVFLDMEASKLD